MAEAAGDRQAGGKPIRGRWTKMAKRAKPARCEDCYFKREMLCALELAGPCPTFRDAERGLRPERQLSFAFRTGRTHAAYAFPQPQ